MRLLTRARSVGALGIIIALLLTTTVFISLGNRIAEETAAGSSKVPANIWEYNSELRIPDPQSNVGAEPVVAFSLPTIMVVLAIGLGIILFGINLIIRNPERGGVATYMNSVIALSFFVILIWAVAGNSVDFSDTLSRMVRTATPLALGALAGLVCERSGVVNIGIEGMMLMGACFGYIAAITSANITWFGAEWATSQGPIWFGVLIAVLTGGIIAALHAALSITFQVDQIISGTVINILAVGVTGYLRSNFIINYESAARSPLNDAPIPFLADIPLLGPLLFDHKPITYMMLFLVVFMHIMLFRTVWGLRTRAIGEHPKAADTVGIKVNRMRFTNVIIGGCFAGLAGAWFSLEATFRFDDLITNGQGFIALAALIFGKWTPLGAFGGALLFSAANALQTKVQTYNSFDMPPQFLQMLPYIVTIIVLAGVIGRSKPPAALGQPYESTS